MDGDSAATIQSYSHHGQCLLREKQNSAFLQKAELDMMMHTDAWMNKTRNERAAKKAKPTSHIGKNMHGT